MKLNLDKHSNYSTLIIRISLGIVFLYFGIDKFIHPLNWFGWIPDYLLNLLPISQNTFIFILGFVETIVGLFLFLGLFTRLASLVASLILIAIIFSLGINEITLRDFGLLGASISLIITGSNKLSIDSLLKKKKLL